MTAIANVAQFSSRTAAASLAPSRVQSVSLTDAAPAQGKLRLTRRGRVVFGGLATVLVAGALGVLASIAAPVAVASSEQGTQQFPYVLAQQGDSLWSIAAELDPAADPREVVAEIARLNQISASDLQAGDTIAVPLRFEGSANTFSGGVN